MRDSNCRRITIGDWVLVNDNLGGPWQGKILDIQLGYIEVRELLIGHNPVLNVVRISSAHVSTYLTILPRRTVA